jgi:hypothetical protein
VEDDHLIGLDAAQRELHPKEDLSQYEGRWVYLRGGYVIDAGDDLGRLVAAHKKQDGDMFLFVSDRDPDAIWIT